jgi:hypothetical protein
MIDFIGQNGVLLANVQEHVESVFKLEVEFAMTSRILILMV